MTRNPAAIAAVLAVLTVLAPVWVPIDLTLKALGRRGFARIEDDGKGRAFVFYWSGRIWEKW
ncbi:hypothetical protein [Mycobacterium phage Azrael100]|nr:hypothetical protein [Mycobacterium phage Azrael100]